MSDDQMDDLIIQAARDYNEPGDVPREEMWARIGAEREARRRATSRGHLLGRPVRRRPLWLWPGVAAAATLLLAAGVGLGRRLERAAPPAASTVAARPDASSRHADSAVARRTEGTPSADATTSEAPRPELGAAYRQVLLEHLAGSEALITAFRSTARSGSVDANIASWSRDLLTTTRMFEASPAAQDPGLRRLLEDLDLVIVQIGQYARRGTANPDDLDLIEQSIDRRGVIAKLRSPLPVRTRPAGT